LKGVFILKVKTGNQWALPLMDDEDALVICREVDRTSGKTAVYPICVKVTDRLFFRLGVRQRANPELRYFVMIKGVFDERGDEIIKRLGRRNFSSAGIEALGVAPLP
jgi:hypothetical protein